MASSLMCLIANINRDPNRGKTFTPADFDPTYIRPPRRVATKSEWQDMRKAIESKYL